VDYGWKKPTAALIIVMLIGMAIDAYGYEIADRKWKGSSFPVYVMDGCPFPTDGLWIRAAHKWDVVGVVEKGKNDSVGYDSRSTLYCSETDPVEISALPPGIQVSVDYLTDKSFTIIASARSYFIDGAMVDVDIRLHPFYVGAWNVEEVMLHEFAHGLGINHSEIPEAIMHYIIPNRPTLHVDDYLAACELYGRCRSMDTMGNISVKNIEYDDECLDVIIPWGWDWKTERNLTITECREAMR